jgi:uncharacterized Fe-S radical SAM superfamily protein PflX
MRLFGEVSRDLWVNVLSQYRPAFEAPRFPVIARGVRPDEVHRVIEAAFAAGLRNVLVDGQPAAARVHSAAEAG